MLFDKFLEMLDCRLAVDLERQDIRWAVFAGNSALENHGIVAVIAEGCSGVFIRHDGRAAAVAGIDRSVSGEIILGLLLLLGAVGMLFLLQLCDVLHFLLGKAAVAVFADEFLFLCRELNIRSAVRAFVTKCIHRRVSPFDVVMLKNDVMYIRAGYTNYYTI